MSFLRAYPTLLRIGLADAFAYRAEMVVWMLATTMPLVMLGLMSAAASDGPITGTGGRVFDGSAFNGYYLATLVVRQVAGSWIVWEMVREIREGSLSLRLLRPLHPLVAYSAQSLAGVPMRAFIALPIFALAWGLGGHGFARDGAHIGLFFLSLAGAWLLNFAVSATIGTLGMYIDSSIAIWELWLGMFMLFSGYLLPLALFPRWLERVARMTPFPYLQSLPVEILTGLKDTQASLIGIGLQWAWAVGALVLLSLVWRGGVRRYSAFGG
jgi:ABC-2 type transport system permease protein